MLDEMADRPLVKLSVPMGVFHWPICDYRMGRKWFMRHAICLKLMLCQRAMPLTWQVASHWTSGFSHLQPSSATGKKSDRLPNGSGTSPTSALGRYHSELVVRSPDWLYSLARMQPNNIDKNPTDGSPSPPRGKNSQDKRLPRLQALC